MKENSRDSDVDEEILEIKEEVEIKVENEENEEKEIKENTKKNEIIVTKNKNTDDVIDIINLLDEKNEKNNKISDDEDSLFYYVNNNKIYNDKKTKIENKKDYLSFINILNEYLNKEEDEFIILFLNSINSNIFNVIINGYINFEFEEIDNDIVCNVIKKIISLFFSKSLFYYVYGKLSKIFRMFASYENKEKLFIKFNKLLDVWKLLYKIEDCTPYIALSGRNYINLDISKLIKSTEINSIKITFDFHPFLLLPLNYNDDNFCFMNNIFFSIFKQKEIKFKDIIIGDKQKINKIQFIITNNDIKYKINEECDLNNESVNHIIMKDNNDDNLSDNYLKEISKIELLKNYKGAIKSIEIVIDEKKNNDNENENKKNELKIVINEKLDISKYSEEEEKIQIDFYPKNEKFIRDKSKRQRDIFYKNIRSYGGMECFIPILKIVKYFIIEFKNDLLKINQLTEFIVEIMKMIINNICHSRKNFENFKAILTPLLGAMAEINHDLPKDVQQQLYNNEIFSLLYVLIVSASVPMALKKAYIMITDLNDVNKLNLNFDNLIVDVNSLSDKYFEWYSLILYIYIEFILIVYNDYDRVPKKIIEQMITMDECNKKNKNHMNEIINLFIGSIKFICDTQNKENDCYKNYVELRNLSHFLADNFNIYDICLKYIIDLIKVFFNLANFGFISLEEINKNNNNNIITNKENNINNNKINENNDNNSSNNNNIDNNNSKDNENIIINDNTNNNNIIIREDKGDDENNIIIEVDDSNNNLINTDNNIKIDNNNNNNDSNDNNSFILKLRNLFYTLEEIFEKPNYFDDNVKKEINKSLEDFKKYKNFIIKIFKLEKNNYFEFESELIIREFTDYHRSYHKLMKNLFIFNRFWSDKKLYFTEEKKQLLKYKSINYFTTNFQRPLLFPVNDYKDRYPNLTNFQINDDFYLDNKEYKDDYNFKLDCPELDEFSIKYEQEIMDKIDKDLGTEIHQYNSCLVKRSHHVKGKLFIFNKNGLISKILFYSYPSEIAKNIPCCNVTKELKHLNHIHQKICYGELFVCPEKDMNIKLIIDVNDIRLIMNRIYFYSKSAIEIYTNTKSYFFNLAEDFSKKGKKAEKYCQNIINMMAYYYKTELFPIKINKDLIGYSRDFKYIIEEYANKYGKNNNLMELENKFISILFDCWKPNEENENVSEFSTFDLIIYLNLLSNRSYVDLFQYPVFPILFFYEKNENENNNQYTFLLRNLNQHIGFQDKTENQLIRKNIIIHTYNESVRENEEFEQNDEEDLIETPFYFKTHYSNNVYTTNFLIRFFPYPFMAIEFQGDNFDTPNRLFFSIEETFFNISFHKADVRELIPEFYYFPEMFMNVNWINFHERSNGKLVDDVEMPSNVNVIDKNINNNNRNNNTNNNNINIINDIENVDKKANRFNCFKFVEKMRNRLESQKMEINNWISIIFGNKQRYGDTKQKKEQYFRDETYINFSKEEEDNFEKYVKDGNIMTSVEFGITPLQTLFEGVKADKNINYDKSIKDYYLNKKYKEKCDQFIDIIKKEREYEKNNKNQKDKNNFELKGDYEGKVSVYINGELYDEIYDHTEEITSIDYNKRLNMFCTTSKDGFLCVYMYPNKLITTIKNENGNYFSKAFLSSNPFPSIIAFDKKNKELISYSINGFFIKKEKLINLFGVKDGFKNPKKLGIFSWFNQKGGTSKDRIIIIYTEERIKDKKKEEYYECPVFTVPFFEKEEDMYEIKGQK